MSENKTPNYSPSTMQDAWEEYESRVLSNCKFSDEQIQLIRVSFHAGMLTATEYCSRNFDEPSVMSSWIDDLESFEAEFVDTMELYARRDALSSS